VGVKLVGKVERGGVRKGRGGEGRGQRNVHSSALGLAASLRATLL